MTFTPDFWSSWPVGTVKLRDAKFFDAELWIAEDAALGREEVTGAFSRSEAATLEAAGAGSTAVFSGTEITAVAVMAFGISRSSGD